MLKVFMKIDIVDVDVALLLELAKKSGTYVEMLGEFESRFEKPRPATASAIQYLLDRGYMKQRYEEVDGSTILKFYVTVAGEEALKRMKDGRESRSYVGRLSEPETDEELIGEVNRDGRKNDPST